MFSQAELKETKPAEQALLNAVTARYGVHPLSLTSLNLRLQPFLVKLPKFPEFPSLLGIFPALLSSYSGFFFKETTCHSKASSDSGAKGVFNQAFYEKSRYLGAIR